MEFKGTKGSWLIEKTGLTEMGYDINTNDNITLIARVRTIEDAKLIAAAPDLLKALQDLKKVYLFNQTKTQAKNNNQNEYLINAEKAIEKALK